MKHYVDLDADDMADELWTAHKSRSTRTEETPKKVEKGSIDETIETLV